jgi:cytochrome c-type biogenesis protein CcsB
MALIENISLLLSLVSLTITLVFIVISFIQHRQIKALNKPSAGMATGAIGTAFIIVALIMVTLTIAARAIESGHAPFSSMYEFAIAFAWGIIVMGIISRWRYKTAAMQNIGLLVAMLLLIFAWVQYSRPASLVPALQQSALLSAHVASAVVAYGTLTIGFAAAILFLIQNYRQSSWLPNAELLDTISYHSVVIGFPFLTLLIVLGALWADIAWGRYWNWDPKETASLVTWLIYAAYIHARLMRGWKGNRAAVLLIAGFAAIMLTFFGNYFFNGLHAYG